MCVCVSVFYRILSLGRKGKEERESDEGGEGGERVFNLLSTREHEENGEEVQPR